jgi:hypothetical protein
VDTFDFCDQILKSYIKNNNPDKDPGVTRHLEALNGRFLSNKTKPMANPSTCSNDTLYNDEWEQYTGTYKMQVKGLQIKWYAKWAMALGYYPYQLKIWKENQVLVAKSPFVISKLRQYQPGLFFTDSGEVIDFTSSPPIYRSIELEKK